MSYAETARFIEECDAIWRQFHALTKYSLHEPTRKILLEVMKLLDNAVDSEVRSVSEDNKLRARKENKEARDNT